MPRVFRSITSGVSPWAEVNAPLLALNRGEVSRSALSRVDVDRLRLAAEMQVNCSPTVLGAMSLRPGLQMIGEVKNAAPANLIPFIYGVNDTALIEVAAGTIRIWVDDALVSRKAVATQLQNPTFAASRAGHRRHHRGLQRDHRRQPADLDRLARGGLAQAQQVVAIAAPDLNVEHALRIVVGNGPVIVRMGSTSGARDVIRQTVLDTGTHSLAFTPMTPNVYLQIESTDAYAHHVSEVRIEPAGDLRASFAVG